ncbi:MAG: hypothetical protein C4581_11550 [Nitrospiraceae bacterium]|nr:MAG: hypothetical protein C4581_11550 [Nitrospiraceae bacterium]
MNYFNYIKKAIPAYLASGVILALSLASMIIMHRYNNELNAALDAIKDISIKKYMVKKEIERTEAMIAHIRDDLDADMTRPNPERLMFRALDDIKSNLPGALITVSRFEEKEDTNNLPVEIEAGIKNYKMILDYVAYIESFRVPDIQITNLTVSEGQSGGIVLKITGVLAMPSADTQM